MKRFCDQRDIDCINADLMSRFYDGENEALDELARRLRPALMHIALNLLPVRHAGRLHTAEDVVQQTLYHVVRTRHRAAARWDVTKGKVQTWLITILRNVLTSHLRLRTNRIVVSTDVCGSEQAAKPSRIESLVPDHRGAAETAAREAEARHRRLLKLISGLPDHVQEVFRLKMKGSTHSQIADCLGIAKSTVAYRYKTGQRSLKG